jgi:hypothetical protein
MSFKPGWLARTSLWSRIAVGTSAIAFVAAGLWPIDRSADDGATPLPADLRALSRQDTGAALLRPIFDPFRRKWTALGTIEDVTGAPRASSVLTLSGILIEEGTKRALLRDGASRAIWLGENEGRRTWRLVDIKPEQVVIVDAGRRYTIEFLGKPVRLRPPPRLARGDEATEPAALRPSLDKSSRL